MNPLSTDPFATNRRHFFKKSATGIGGMALASLLANDSDNNGVLGGPEIAPKAKRVIYLFQSGGPSQFELFADTPYLPEHHGGDRPN
ncbi:MAG: sulfatase, partial [Akkermansiaceae bacterium]